MPYKKTKRKSLAEIKDMLEKSDAIDKIQNGDIDPAAGGGGGGTPGRSVQFFTTDPTTNPANFNITYFAGDIIKLP